MNIVLLFLFLTWKVTTSQDLRISEVSVLLNWNSSGIELKAYGPNCFFWSTSGQKVVRLEHRDGLNLNDGCSFSVWVVPGEAVYGQRMKSVVYARDSETGETLKCEFFVDDIYSLQLLTTARKLILGELEVLRVQAFDFKDNVFSTLRGNSFAWKVTHPDVLSILPIDTGVAKFDHLTLLGLSSASTTGLEELCTTDGGCETDVLKNREFMVAVGNRVGKSTVTVSLSNLDGSAEVMATPTRGGDRSLSYHEMSGGARVIVDFYVVDNFLLYPGDLLYVLPNSEFQYKLVKIVDEEEDEVPMPFGSFVWEVSDGSAGIINAQTGRFRAHEKTGGTGVLLYDAGFPENNARGYVFIVEPVYLKVHFTQLNELNPFTSEFSFPEINGNNLVLGRDYRVEVVLYDKDHNAIYQSANVDFDVRVEEGAEVIDVNFKKKRGSTLKLGKFIVSAALLHPEYDISARSEFYINPKVHIIGFEDTKNVIRLPIDGLEKQDQRVELSGGTGSFSLFVAESEIVSLEDNNVILSRAVGETTLLAIDRDNFHNWHAVTVAVSFPHAVTFAPGVREAALGEVLCVELSVRNSQGHKFSAFNALNITFNVVGIEKPFRMLSRDLSSASCGELPEMYGFYAENLGNTRIDARFKSMSDSIKVNVFSPFEIAHPALLQDDGSDIVVTLGASVRLQMRGGPRVWPNHKCTIKRYARMLPVEHSNRGIAVIHEMSYMEVVEPQKEYFLKCVDFGKSVFEIEILHQIEGIGAKPTRVLFRRVFSCQSPKEAYVVPLLSLPPEREGVKLREMQQVAENKYHIQNNQTVPWQIVMLDSSEHRFINHSTIETKWHVGVDFNEGGVNPKDVRQFEPVQNFEDLLTMDLIEHLRGIILITLSDIKYDMNHLLVDDMIVERAVNTLSFSSLAAVKPPPVTVKVTSSIFIYYNCSNWEGYLDWKQCLSVPTSKVECLSKEEEEEEDSYFPVFPAAGNEINAEIQGGSGKFDVTANYTEKMMKKNGDAFHLILSVPEHNKFHLEVKKVRKLGDRESRVASRGIQIRASDVLEETKQKKTVHSVVRLTDVQGVLIRGSNFIEMKQSAPDYIHISAHDDRFVDFDGLQLKHMKMELRFLLNVDDDLETVPLDEFESDIINVKECQFGKFQVFGKKPGVVGVIARVTNARGVVLESPVFLISVFTPFEVDPKELLLIPGSRYQISTIGGPGVNNEGLSIYTEYKIIGQVLETVEGENIDPQEKDESTAAVITVDEWGVISALNYGHVEIRVFKYYRDDREITNMRLDVRVVRMNSIDSFFTPSRQIYSGVDYPMHIFGRSSYGLLPPINLQSPYFGVEWELVPSSNYSSSRSNKKNCLILEKSENTPCFVYLKSKTCQMGSSFNLKARAWFNHPEMDNLVWVAYSTIKIDVPFSVTKYEKNSILLPPNSRYDIKPNKESFEITSIPLKDGEIISIYDQDVNLLPRIVSREKTGVQGMFMKNKVTHETILLEVAVAHPSMIDLVSGRSLNELYLELELFDEVEREIVVGNEWGRRFSTSVGMAFSVRMTHFNIIEHYFYDDLLVIEAVGAGTTLLQVMGTEIPHYVLFVVKPRILPVDDEDDLVLYLGDSIPFTVDYGKAPIYSGSWGSSDNSVLEIYPRSGLSKCVGSGSVSLWYTSEETGKTTRELTVRNIVDISLLSKITFKNTDEKSSFYFRLLDDANEMVDLQGRRGIKNNIEVEMMTTSSVSSSRDGRITFTKTTPYTENKYQAEFIVDPQRLSNTTVKFQAQIVVKLTLENSIGELVSFEIGPKEVTVEKSLSRQEKKTMRKHVERKQRERKSMIKQLGIAALTIFLCVFIYNVFLHKFFGG